MNAFVVAFAVILIVGGIISGVNFIIVLGIFLLIPGLLANPRKQTKIPVSKSQQQPRRVSAPTSYLPPTTAETTPPASMPMHAQPPSYMTGPLPTSTSPLAVHAPALFPNAIFPTLSLPSTYRQQVPQPQEKQTEQRDELLEIGVLVAILKFVSG